MFIGDHIKTIHIQKVWHELEETENREKLCCEKMGHSG